MNVEHEISLKIDLNYEDYEKMNNALLYCNKYEDDVNIKTVNEVKLIFNNLQYDNYKDCIFRQILTDFKCVYERKKNITTRYESILLSCLNDIINLKITKAIEYTVNVNDEEYNIFLNTPLVMVNRICFFIPWNQEIYRCALEHIIVENKNIFYCLTIECEKKNSITPKDINNTTLFLDFFFQKFNIYNFFLFNKHIEYISFDNLLSLSGNLKLKRSFKEINSIDDMIFDIRNIEFYSLKLDGTRNIVLLTPTSIYIIDRYNRMVRHYNNNIQNSFYYVGFVESFNSNTDFIIDILYCISDVSCNNARSHPVSVSTAIKYLKKIKLNNLIHDNLKINNYIPVNDNNDISLYSKLNSYNDYSTDGWLFYSFDNNIYKLKNTPTIDCIITLKDWISSILKIDKKMKKKHFKFYLEQNIPFTREQFGELKKYHYLFKDLLCLYDTKEKVYKPIKKKFTKIKIEWVDFNTQIVQYFNNEYSNLINNFIIVECTFINNSNKIIVSKNRYKNSPNTFSYCENIINNLK
ncbi:MAG: RNA polymerase subunit lef-4 [Cotesia congregata filamentous virus 2]